MYRGNSSRIVPIILVLVVIALVIAALVSVGRAIFGGGEQPNQEQVDISRDTLLDTSSGHSVRMTVRGPIVADEDFRSYQITISPSQRFVSTYSGYLTKTLNSKRYGNNTKAYEELVYSLDKANMVKGDELPDEKDDTRGICATGNVYEFEVLEGGRSVKRLWTSTCKGSPGSFKASVSQVQNLFLKQIPDEKELLKDVKLSSQPSLF